MKYYIIAGEASGDLHGSNLMKGLKKHDTEATFRILGGDLMETQGGNLLKHYRNMAFMGIVSVLQNLKTIKKNLRDCQNDILEFKPDVVILIDYPGFNLRIARFAKENGFKVFYYISPKIWAWNKGRIKQIKAFVDKLFVIFPFEIDFYKKYHYSVTFEGNPLIDSVSNFKSQNGEDFLSFTKRNELPEKPILALLAGSRRQEIEFCLPDMIEASKEFTDYQIVIAGAPSIEPSFYSRFIAGKNASIVYGQTYHLLNNAKMAVVTSGTATLETALFKVPQVVIYKTQGLTFIIGRSLVWIKYFSLVNIVANREVVKEFLQFNLVENIRKELKKINENESYRSKMIDSYNEIEQMLGKPGVSERSAKIMIDSLI